MRNILTLIFLIGLMAGCGGGKSNTAEEALKRQIGYLSKGQYGRAYAELHPAQQAFIPESLYTSCGTESPGQITGVTVVESYTEDTTIPGTTQRVPSTALTVRIAMRRGSTTNSITTTMHEYLVEGQWRFAVRDGDAYKAGRCP